MAPSCAARLAQPGQQAAARACSAGAGALFINASQERLRQFEDIKFQGLQGASARKIVLVVGIMAAHALGEGSGVGVSFCGTRGWAQARPLPRPACVTACVDEALWPPVRVELCCPAGGTEACGLLWLRHPCAHAVHPLTCRKLSYRQRRMLGPCLSRQCCLRRGCW